MVISFMIKPITSPSMKKTIACLVSSGAIGEISKEKMIDQNSWLRK